MDLIYKNEKPLLRISFVLSAIFWITILIVSFGTILIYLLFGYLFFLFAHSAFISYLKGTGVKIGPEQYPDLNEKLVNACGKIGLKEIPDAYLLRTDSFNAIATKFLRKHFIVLYTDVVDALHDRPNAIDFYIGHELGHVHRKHLNWTVFLFPASILPLLGPALRRAEEYTCDKYGVACCHSSGDIQAAISTIAAGDTRWKTMNVNSYVKQVKETKGFWMSFNELTSDYPWLTKRMAAALSTAKGKNAKFPKRHLFAWILSCFVPRFGVGGSLISLMMIVAVIGILAAVALPAYQDYTIRAQYTEAYNSSNEVKNKVTDYVTTNNEWPKSLEALGFPNSMITNKHNHDINLYEQGLVIAKVGVKDNQDMLIVLKPEVTNSGTLTWQCFGENILQQLLPPACRQ